MKTVQLLLQQVLVGHAHGHLPLKRLPVFLTHHFGSKCRSVRVDGLAKQADLAPELFLVCHFTLPRTKRPFNVGDLADRIDNFTDPFIG
jgi:hypothetical protein